MKLLGSIKTRMAGKGKFGVAGILAAGMAVGGIGFGTTASAASSLPYNSVGSAQLVNRSIQSYDMNSGLVNALLAVPTNGVSSSAKIAPGAIDITDLNGALQQKVNAVGTGAPGLSYGCDGKVVDSTHPAATCPGKDGTNGTNGTDGKDGVAGVHTDEPYGANLPGQDSSSTTIPAGKTAVIWTACAAGEAALGGGYRLGDLANESFATGEAVTYPDLQVVASEAAFYQGGKLVNGSVAAPVNDNQSFRPNAWAVTVHNAGTTDSVARASVVCAKVAG